MNWTLFLQLIATLETGGHPDPDNAIGDNGRALGRYQIHKCFVDDVNDTNWFALKLKHEEMHNPDIACITVKAWHIKYARINKDIGDYVAMARRHNGGPRGHLKRSTLEYGRRAQAWLDAHGSEYGK